MFPRIDTQQRHMFPRHRVLVRQRHNLQLSRLLVLHEPAPSTPLDPRQRRIDDLLERVVGAPRGVDAGRERATRGCPAAGRPRREVLPEKRVVQVSSATLVISLSLCVGGGENK